MLKRYLERIPDGLAQKKMIIWSTETTSFCWSYFFQKVKWPRMRHYRVQNEQEQIVGNIHYTRRRFKLFWGLYVLKKTSHCMIVWSNLRNRKWLYPGNTILKPSYQTMIRIGASILILRKKRENRNILLCFLSKILHSYPRRREIFVGCLFPPLRSGLPSSQGQPGR